MASPSLASSRFLAQPPAYGTAPPRSLEHDLTTFFLTAKRSLDSKDLIVRAASLVTNTKAALEHAAVLLPKCVYLRNALEGQLNVVRGLNGLMKQGRKSFAEYVQTTSRDFEDAHANLSSILKSLQKTVLEPAFAPEQTEPRTLHDFVDDAGIDRQLSEIRGMIDRAQASINRYTDTLSNFSRDLTTLSDALASLPPTSSNQPSILHPTQNPIPRSLSALDHHTVALVDSFEKLNHHYTQCVDALQCTDAGAAALAPGAALARVLSTTALATLNSRQPPEATSVTTSRDPAAAVTSDADAVRPLLQSLSPSEFALLSTDSSAVPDVLDDMNHSLSTMSYIYNNDVLGHISALEACSDATNAALARFEDFQASLGSYVVASTEFEAAQKEYQSLIHPALERLASLAEFYAGFARAYDEMVVEVGRRMGVRNKMEQIMRGALREIEELYEHDALKREEFKNETGDFLPVDIWPGLMDPPMRYNVEAIGGDIPVLRKEVLSKALRTLNGI